MKIITYLSLFLATLNTIAQRHVDTQWADQINNTFEDIEKFRVPHGVLLDYAMEFTDVPSYNGVIGVNTSIDLNTFSNIYKTLYMGLIVPDTTHSPQLKTIGQRWYQERIDRNMTSQETIVIAGQYYKPEFGIRT